MGSTKPLPSSFPDERADPNVKKGKDWLKQSANAVFANYTAMPARAIGYKSVLRYQKIKSYALGRQEVQQYKDRIYRGKDERGQKKDGNLKTDWTVLPIFPKFRSILLARCDEAAAGYKAIAMAIDDAACKEKKEYISKVKAKVTMRDAATLVGAPAMLQHSDVQPEPGEPDDMDGCNLMELGIRHKTDSEVEKLIESVKDQNEYDRLRMLRDEDLCDYGICALKDDTEDSNIVIRRVDPERLVMNYCLYPDLRDLRYVGELLEVPVSALISMSDGQLTETDLQIIYKHGQTNSGTTQPSFNGTWTDYYSKGTVRVLDLEIRTTDEVAYEERTNKYGNPVFGRTKADRKGNIKKKIQNLYRIKWVVGTDICYDYGQAFDIKRPPGHLAQAKFTYHIEAISLYHMDARSRTEECIPYIDAIQMAWYRLQNALNTVVPKGYEIDVSALEAVTMKAGGQVMSPQKIVDFFFETGVLLSRSQGPGVPGQQRRAIVPLEGGVGNEIAEFWTLINNNIELIRQTLGVNELTDGSTPNAKTLIPIAQMAQTATNNALADLFGAGRRQTAAINDSIVIRAQDIYEYGDKKAFIARYGTGAGIAMDSIENIDKYIYSTTLLDLPTAEEEQYFQQQLLAAQEKGQVTIADVYRLRHIVNIKEREERLAYAVKKNEETQQQKALQLQQANGQVQQQSAQASEQAKQQTIQVQLQADIQRIKVEKDLELRNGLQLGEITLRGKQIDGASRVEGFSIQAEERAQRGVMDNHTDIIKSGMQTGLQMHAGAQEQDHALYQESQQPAATQTDNEQQEAVNPQPQQQPGFSFLQGQQQPAQQQAPEMAMAAQGQV